MTKMRSKKMTKSTFAIIIMAVVMVALLAFGGTYAYFTASAKDITGTVTFGEVKLNAAGSTFTAQSNVVPGTKFASGLIEVDNHATVPTYIVVKMSVKYVGDYYTRTADGKWTETTDGTITQLSEDQITEAFDGLTVASGWAQINSTTYLMESGSNYQVPARSESTKPVLFLGTAGDPTNTTADINVKNFNRHYAEVNTAEEEQPPVWEMKLQIPLKNGAADWEEDDVYLAWEGARVTISFVAHQIQAQGISVTGSGTEGAILANDVWTAIQGPLNLA